MAPAHHFSDDIPSKAASGQKAHLLGLSRGIGGRLTELAAPDLARTLELGTLQIGHRGGHGFGAHALGLQLVLHARRAEPAGTPVQHRRHHALLIDEALGLQLIECADQFTGLGFVGLELALQLGTRMLTAGQQTQRATLQ
ncbi:hypothetical protein D9M68_893680 [compost metagenome]